MLTNFDDRKYEGITFGGAEGIRTPDLLNANQALSQLSYSPVVLNGGRYRT
jgi:hypothetical protein